MVTVVVKYSVFSSVLAISHSFTSGLTTFSLLRICYLNLFSTGPMWSLKMASTSFGEIIFKCHKLKTVR